MRKDAHGNDVGRRPRLKVPGPAGLRRTLVLSVPGVLLFGLQYFAALFRGSRFDAGAYAPWAGWGYVIGEEALLNYPLEALLSWHIQTPGLSLLYLAALQTGSSAVITVQVVWFLMMALSVGFTVATFVELGASDRWSGLVGVAYSLTPSLVNYAFWGYVPTPLFFFSTLAVFGIALISRRPAMGLAATSLGAMGLFLTRGTYFWVAVTLWIAAAAVIALRRLPRNRWIQALVAPALLVALVLALQSHRLIQFDTWTMTSWGSGSLLRTAWLGLDPDVERALRAEDACTAEVLETGSTAHAPFVPIDAFPSCVERYSAAGKAVPELADVGEELNETNALPVLQGSWARSDVLRHMLLRDPLLIPRYVLGTHERSQIPEGYGLNGTLYTYLGLPEVDWQPGVRQLVGWTATTLVAWLLIFLGLGSALFRRSSRRRPAAYWFSLALASFAAAYAILGERTSNMRVAGEGRAALFLAAALSAYFLWSDWRRARSNTARTGERGHTQRDART